MSQTTDYNVYVSYNNKHIRHIRESSTGGYEVYASETVVLRPGEDKEIRTGVTFSLPAEKIGQLYEKQYMIDNDIYLKMVRKIDISNRSEFKIKLVNRSNKDFTITANKNIVVEIHFTFQCQDKVIKKYRNKPVGRLSERSNEQSLGHRDNSSQAHSRDQRRAESRAERQSERQSDHQTDSRYRKRKRVDSVDAIFSDDESVRSC